MLDIFQKMDAYSYAILDIQSQNILTDAPSKISGLLEIIKNANGRNVARFSSSLSNTADVAQFWYGVFTWDPRDMKFQGWHEIPDTEDQLHINPTLQFDLNGVDCQLRRSNSNFQDLSIVLDNETFYPLIKDGVRNFALSSELPQITIYRALTDMGLPTTGVSIVDIYDKMPTYSLCLLDLNNSSMIVDGPENGSGLLEICKIAGRNFARYTKSNSSASSIEGMWYGSFKWSGGTAFTGWHKIATDTDISSLQSSFQDGVDTLYNKCVSCGSTPSNKTPTAISNSIQSIYNNRYSSGRNDVYKTSKTTTGYGNLAISLTSKPSSGTYTVDENTFNIPIKNKFLHKITCNLVHRFSCSYTDASAFTSGMQITISTVEGTTLYTAYVHKTNSNDTVLMDGQTYNYSWEFDTLDHIINTSYDYIKFYARCFVRMQYASYVNSINMTFQINNITANYH